MREVKRSVRKDSSGDLRSEAVRMALAEGFFMNTARRAPNMKASAGNSSNDASYLTVNEGLMARLDRNANSSVFTLQDYYPDWLIYTDMTAGSSSGQQQGIMRMAFEIDLQWVQDKIPRLKDIDVNRLCGLEPPK